MKTYEIWTNFGVRFRVKAETLDAAIEKFRKENPEWWKIIAAREYQDYVNIIRQAAF